MDTTTPSVVVRRSRRRRPVRRSPAELHVLTFRIMAGGARPLYATVLVRGRMGQNAAIGPAYDQARLRGGEAFCTDIRTVPSPRQIPALDAFCRRWTGFTSFVALLTATAGYRPSIRLDLNGREGVVLARAYDRQQARWGDKRRAFVTGDLPPRRAQA